jgi:phage N-6-adenine-methyltransferase
MSLVAFKARNHPQQAVRDAVDDRGTLPQFFDQLHAEHSFTIDVAASAGNAKLPRFWTVEHDALRQSWRGERVWCNPPYSKLEPWVEKAWIEMVDGGCDRVVMLLPANRCEQGFWQRHVEPYRDGEPFHGALLCTRFLAGRMRFQMPPGHVWGPSRKKGDRPPFGCVLLTWTPAVASSSTIPQHPHHSPEET